MTKKAVTDAVRDRVYEIADKADWKHLTIDQRRAYYEQWTDDPDIGGALRKVMNPNKVRVYLKDSIMGSYSRLRRFSIRDLLMAKSISCGKVVEEFIKPQAVLCDGTHLYTLTSAKDWKISLLNAFERGQERPSIQGNLMYIIQHTTGRFVDASYRAIIEEAAKRLGVSLHWVT